MRTVIDMAREAGFSLYRDISAVDGSIAQLERLVELARADEREACAKVVDAKIEEVKLYTNEYHLLQVAAAIRERSKNT